MLREREPGDLDPRSLVGAWDLDRRLADRRSGQSGRMRGTLHVRPSAAGLRWEEEGTLFWGGKRLQAHRLLRRVDGEWWMTFTDGGLFHPWRPGERLEHPCRADRYLGRVDLAAPGQMRILWDVHGPSKRQRIFTRYVALAGA